MTTARPLPLGYRLGVASRVLAAAAGGYAVATLGGIALALMLPMVRIDAAVTGALLTIILLPVAAMACFWARTAARAWIGMAIACALLAALAFELGWRP